MAALAATIRPIGFAPRTAQERRLPPFAGKTADNRTDEQQHSATLVRRCVAGDPAAWEEIVRLHNRRVYNLCFRFTGSNHDAEDLSQEVFIKIYRTLKTYNVEKGAFTTWIATLTRNLLVDHYRSSKQQRLTDSLDAAPESQSQSKDNPPALSDKLADAAPSPEVRMQQHDTQKMVQNALAQLSPELREAVILRDLQDLDYREIAQVLRVPEGTVKSRINRGRTELARLLQRIYRQV